MAATDAGEETRGSGLPRASVPRNLLTTLALLLATEFVLTTVGCNGQPSYVIEKTIPLPDSLCGLSYDAIAYSRRDNRVLVDLQDGRTLVLDATTGQKLSTVPSNDPGAPVYDPISDEIYLSSSDSGSHTDAHRDSMLSALAHVRMQSPEEMCVDPVVKRICCYLHSWSYTLMIFDGQTLSVVESLPYCGHERLRSMCCNSRMHLLYWTQSGDDSGPTVIDLQTGHQVGTAKVGRYAEPLCYNWRQNKLYVAATDSGRSEWMLDRIISIVDCRTNKVAARLQLGSDRMCYSARENKVYAAADSGVVVIDGTSDRVIARIPVPYRPDDIVYDSVGNRLYCCGDDWVAAIDCHSDTAAGLVRTNTSAFPSRLAFCAPINKLYYLQVGEVYGVDCTGFTVASRATVRFGLGALLYNGRVDKVYCANRWGDQLAVLDAAAETVRSVVHVGRVPIALCCNGSGTQVYCASMGGSASVIDGLSDTVVTTIKIRGAPVAMCSCTPHDKVYCAGTEPSEPAPDTSTNHAVSVIDCRTNRVIKELEVPMDDGSRIVYDSLRDRVYVTVGSGIDARVTMIDAGRDKVVATRPAGIGPDRREGIAGRLGARATGEVVYAPRHKRVFAASEQNSVVVLREDRGSEDIGQALRQFSRSVGNWWGRLSRPAERAQTGI